MMKEGFVCGQYVRALLDCYDINQQEVASVASIDASDVSRILNDRKPADIGYLLKIGMAIGAIRAQRDRRVKKAAAV